MDVPSSRVVGALVLLNLALQVTDGVATWFGLQAGYGEGNPFLRSSMMALGAGPALALFKLEACACVLLLWRLRHNRLAAPALVLSAVIYLTCAIGPWAVALAQAHLRSYALS